MGIKQRQDHIAFLIANLIDLYSSRLLHLPNPLPLSIQQFNLLSGELGDWIALGGNSANDEDWKKLFQEAA